MLKQCGKRLTRVTLYASLIAFPSLAQQFVRDYNATLSLPFGTAQGRLVVAGVQVVFIDQANVRNSIVVARSDLMELTNAGSSVTAQLRAPIRDSQGERTRLTFQLPNEEAAASVAEWYKQQPTESVQESDSDPPAGKSFPARHKKLFGDSHGRLIVGASGIDYESIDDINDSRRWRDSDIKEMKLKNPYELELVPFSGDGYNFVLEGQGMGTADYQQLVNRITRSRAR